MTINVHETHEAEYVAKGYVEVTRTHWRTPDGEFDRIDFVDPATTCLKPMRKWTAHLTPMHGETYARSHGIQEHHGYCLLEKGHKGKRHATVVYYCDACGKTRRGNGAQYSYREEGVTICWFCQNVDVQPPDYYEQDTIELRP